MNDKPTTKCQSIPARTRCRLSQIDYFRHKMGLLASCSDHRFSYCAWRYGCCATGHFPKVNGWQAKDRKMILLFDAVHWRTMHGFALRKSWEVEEGHELADFLTNMYPDTFPSTNPYLKSTTPVTHTEHTAQPKD
jgi:hypothetical protein